MIGSWYKWWYRMAKTILSSELVRFTKELKKKHPELEGEESWEAWYKANLQFTVVPPC